jgi:hypothetical protein
VQRAVDLPVAGAREPVADLIAGGRVDGRGAVPRGELPRVGNQVMSPTSTSSRAAPDGPMPCRLIRVVPVAARLCRLVRSSPTSARTLVNGPPGGERDQRHEQTSVC